MKKRNLLFAPESKLRLGIMADNESRAYDCGLILAQSGLTVRYLRGRKMRSRSGLFDEFAAALQFPPYFGENGNAFDECLADLSWLPPLNGYVLVLFNAEQVLVDSDELVWFVGAMARASEIWARPIESGEWWDRAAVPFHVILQAEERMMPKFVRRWSAAGGDLLAVSPD